MNTAIGRPWEAAVVGSQAAGTLSLRPLPDDISEIEVSTSESIVQGIDHLIVMVRDLDRAQALWQRLGFATTARGFHRTGGTANHLIMLDRTYIELLGMADPSAPLAYPQMMADPGLWGVALRGTAEATGQLWRSNDFRVEGPTELARGVQIGGQDEVARFRLTMLERSPELPFLLFCCEHLTPQFVWHSHLPAHPNGARRLRELIVLVQDGATRDHLERITGRAASTDPAGQETFAFADTRIALLTAARFAERFGGAPRFGTQRTPRLAGFVVASAELARARQFAETSGCSVRDAAAGGFAALLPDEGVVIEWVPES